MSKYITYTIEALENIKMGQTLKQMGSEETMDYITGSAIRGAYIYKYIKKYNISDINQGEHRNKLLNGRIKFLNAYPSDGKSRSTPLPKCYFAPKEDMKCFQDNLKIMVGIDQKLEVGYEKVRLSEFVNVQGNDFEKVIINKVSNLHIQKGKQKNALFQYESIEKGQVFRGIIKLENDEDSQEIEDLLGEAIVYIGGSKGSGYGKCQISNLEIQDGNPELQALGSPEPFKNEFYLVALSDIIYRNALGEYKTTFDEEFLQEKLEVEGIRHLGSSIETKDITSFNNKWRCSTPLIRGIKAGSVFKYTANGTLDQQLCHRLMDTGVGERKQDGYGRIIILPHLGDAVFKEIAIKEELTNMASMAESHLNNDEINQVEKIISQVLRLKIERLIPSIVLEEYNNIKNAKGMKSSQWGNYMDLFMYLQYLPIQKAKEVYSEHIYHVESKGNNPLKKLKYQGDSNLKSFKDYLDTCILTENVNDVFVNRYFPEAIKMDGITAKLTSRIIFQINMMVLIQICHYHLRKGDESL